MATPEDAPRSIRSCYDKLRKAVSNIPMDASKSAKIENLASEKISEILPNLYLSGRTVAQNHELLREKNVKTVINVSDREIPNYTATHPTIRNYKYYTMSDTASGNFDGIVEEAVTLIHETRIRGGKHWKEYAI
ncbi:unnamed protein product [Caenorhabditis brenneri]